jgi:uncharacterized repeat protein (TIGR03803 family)
VLLFVLAPALIAVQTAQAQTLHVLHAFTGGTDGGYPLGSLLRDAAGNLYGTTSDGGVVGTVFKVDTSGKETVLYSFAGGSDGAFPQAGLVRDAAGNLYGTTAGGGGSGCFQTQGLRNRFQSRYKRQGDCASQIQ